MNEFNVLLAAATNGTPSGSLFDALFARYIAPQESWRELESPLPITILAAGEDLIDYRIFGNTVQNGTPTPENPIVPSGCGERTAQIFDISKVDNGSAVTHSGDTISMLNVGLWYDLLCFTTGSSASLDVTKGIFLAAGTYTIKIGQVNRTSGTGSVYGIVVFSEDGTSTEQLVTAYDINNSKKTFTTATDGYISLRVSAGNPTIQGVVLTAGSIAPTSYIPYGYKLPMVVTNGTTTTTTPIYIGTDPLAEDEYVDFGEQKIYRMVNGTLTPTDPPAPIPALPTIQGKTIIDYNPSTTPAVEPEKMYIKYKPQ